MAGVNDNLIPPVKGEIRNPKGKPKGTKHLSTHIQNLLNDESFTADIIEGYVVKPYKGAPVKAIVRVAAMKAIAGDTKWADWLGKYGYGTKLELSNDPENPISNPVSDNLLNQFLTQVQDNTKR